MKNLILILLTISTSVSGQECIDIPKDLGREKILIYLNSFDESTKLINEEFERTNDIDKKTRRIQDLSKYSLNQYGKPIAQNDTYGIAVEEKIVNWMNESITKICGQLKEKNFQIVNAETLEKYTTENYRYVLKYKYVIENGDPIKTQMFFYFHDRQINEDLNSLSNKLFNPFFYYTGDKWYPFYGVMRVTKVKNEWTDCLRNL